MSALESSIWAEETFGRASLGDPRRTRRLVRIAELGAQSPAGTVTQSAQRICDREGAFRFLESRKVASDEVSRAVFESTAQLCGKHEIVYVVVDQTDLKFVDRKNQRGLGPDHLRASETCRGLQVM